DSTSAGILVFQDDRFVYANRAVELIAGYPLEEIIGKQFWMFAHPEHRDLIRERGLARQRGEKLPNRYEFKILTKFGEEKWVDTAAVLTEWKGKPAVVATIFDITERKRAEEDLRESERRFAELFDNASDVVYVHDLDGNILALNRAGEIITGYSREEALTMNISQVVAPEYLQTVREMVDAKLRGQPRTTYEVQLIKKDGTRIFVEISSQIIYQNGKPFAVEGVARDVTERKKIEAERDRLIMALEHSADAIVITDADANIQYVNPAFERITGYSREEVLGKNPRILKSGKHGPEFYKGMWDTISRGDVWTGRITNRKKDGSLYMERCTISSVRDSSGQIVNYVAVKRDITERVALEERLRQSQKMEAVGQLAGGVAHDFNNILTAISGYSDLLLRNLKDGDPKRTYAAEIKKASERAAALTQQLLAFSRRQVISPKVVNLNNVVKDMARMLERIIGENIDLVTLLSEDLWNVKVDPSQIEQVIMNLSVNAKDAMPNGGKLIIETANVHLDEEYAKIHAPLQPGPYVMLAVTDTGCGMDAETLSHVFEPFFTTKEKGKGTGLGLATVYGIVKQSDGYIWVYSEPGKGTTFKIYFPPVWEELSEEDTSEHPVSDLTGKETILLVEDETSVRQLLKNVLEMHGYKVLDAGNGEDALAAADEYEGDIHLLITDVVMPGMGGPALSEKLLQTRPNMKVIYMSGYTNDALLHRGDLKEGTVYLQKPFPLTSLAEKAREILNGSGESA
ncbi:MAG: PAS domain S-box protein, partial [Armatimonadota bacterium]